MLQIRLYPHTDLTTKCNPVESFDSELHSFLDELKNLMTISRGIGIAANQVGRLDRIFLLKHQNGLVTEFINPEIAETTGSVMIAEGCLSAKRFMIQIPRPQEVTIKYQNRNGEVRTAIACDLEAVCVMHEYDHLNGIFYLDKAPRNQRRAGLKALGLR